MWMICSLIQESECSYKMSVRMNLCGHRTIIEKTKITGKSHINISIRLTLGRGSTNKNLFSCLNEHDSGIAKNGTREIHTGEMNSFWHFVYLMLSFFSTGYFCCFASRISILSDNAQALYVLIYSGVLVYCMLEANICRNSHILWEFSL